MSITAADFVRDFREFADADIYPTEMITWWMNYAALFLNKDRWGLPGSGGSNPRTEYDIGQEFVAAHMLVLEAKAIKSAKNGNPPGVAEGMVNNKSVDKVSIGFDTASIAEVGAGHWNLTTYGLRFKYLLRLFGAGPVQIGIGIAPPFSGCAWPGPWYANFPNMSG